VEVADWDAGTGNLMAKRTENLGTILAVALAPGGQRLTTALEDRALLLWELTPWSERCRLEASRPLSCALAISDDGNRLATADFGDVVTVWDVTGSRPPVCCSKHIGVVCLTFASGSAVLASGGCDNTVRLWDAVTGQPRGALPGHTSLVQAVQFSPDGATLASADVKGTVKLWDVAAQTERDTLRLSGDEVAALAFSPDSRRLAVAVDRAVQLWDVATGRLVTRLDGHEGKVICLAYSPDSAL
jgi:WD40 repeat protein